MSSFSRLQVAKSDEFSQSADRDGNRCEKLKRGGNARGILLKSFIVVTTSISIVTLSAGSTGSTGPFKINEIGLNELNQSLLSESLLPGVSANDVLRGFISQDLVDNDELRNRQIKQKLFWEEVSAMILIIEERK
jgi:hypothetical protein